MICTDFCNSVDHTLRKTAPFPENVSIISSFTHPCIMIGPNVHRDTDIAFFFGTAVLHLD